LLSFLQKNYRHPLALFIKKVFGFLPGNILLYELALTHKSASIYQNKDYSINNERLEFLGDAVLNTIIGEYLFLEYLNENEGFLTNLRSKVVSRHMLNEIAKQIEIQKVVKLHCDVSDNGSLNIYGNALEAIIGAIFMDKGYDFVKKIVLNKIIDPYIDWNTLIQNDTNYKSQIIDWAQKHHFPIEFKCENTSLPNNQHGYLAELYINENVYGKGKGITKKEAEQQASKEALDNIPPNPLNL
jgi:ribonuclease-3